MENISPMVLIFVSLFLLLLPLFHLIIIFLIVDIVDYFGS